MRNVNWKVKATGEPFTVALEDHEYELFVRMRDRVVGLPEGQERSEALNELCFLMEGKRAGARLISEEEMDVKGLMYGAPSDLDSAAEPGDPSAEVLQLREDTLETMERLEAQGFKIPAQAKLEVAGLMQASLLDPDPGVSAPPDSVSPGPDEDIPAEFGPKARNDDPETSHAAAEQVLKTTAGSQRGKLLAAFVTSASPLIDEEAASVAGVSLQSEYATRCSELRNAGLIEATGGERLGSAGVARIVCRATDAGRKFYEEMVGGAA